MSKLKFHHQASPANIKKLPGVFEKTSLRTFIIAIAPSLDSIYLMAMWMVGLKEYCLGLIPQVEKPKSGDFIVAFVPHSQRCWPSLCFLLRHVERYWIKCSRLSGGGLKRDKNFYPISVDEVIRRLDEAQPFFGEIHRVALCSKFYVCQSDTIKDFAF